MSVMTGRLLTVTDISREAKAPPHRVTYVIDTRGIAPVARFGPARVFDEDAVDRIKSALAETEWRHRGVGVGARNDA